MSPSSGARRRTTKGASGDGGAAGLDDAESAELSELIRSLARDWGIAVLLVEHNLDMVLRLCDTVTVMVGGKLLFCGAPDEVRTHPGVLEAYVGEHGGTSDTDPSSTDPSVNQHRELDRMGSDVK